MKKILLIPILLLTGCTNSEYIIIDIYDRSDCSDITVGYQYRWGNSYFPNYGEFCDIPNKYEFGDCIKNCIDKDSELLEYLSACRELNQKLLTNGDKNYGTRK